MDFDKMTLKEIKEFYIEYCKASLAVLYIQFPQCRFKEIRYMTVKYLIIKLKYYFNSFNLIKLEI